MPKTNRHRGSRLETVLRDEDLYDDVQVVALKRAIAEAMIKANLSKVEMARRMRTSRSQFDRVLDPACTTVQLDSLIRAASALGRGIRIALSDNPPWREEMLGPPVMRRGHGPRKAPKKV